MSKLDAIPFNAHTIPGLPSDVASDTGRQAVRAVLWALFRKHYAEPIPLDKIPAPKFVRPALALWRPRWGQTRALLELLAGPEPVAEDAA